MKQARASSTSKLTFWLMAMCCCIFVLVQLTTPSFKHPLKIDTPTFAVDSSPIEKALIYDYPTPFEKIDAVTERFGKEIWEKGEPIPPKATALIEEAAQIPVWRGFYPEILAHFQHSNFPDQGPWFEKISQGQIWRLFTPCLLHYDMFHLFFNLIWIAALGRPLESFLGKSRFVFFCLFTGIVSNTAQYLMTGAAFMGISGVLAGMLGFWWVLQATKKVRLLFIPPSAIRFVLLFLIAMGGISWLAFVSVILGGPDFSPSIANTAHLTGIASGALLALIPQFRRIE